MTHDEAVGIIRSSALEDFAEELIAVLRPSARLYPVEKVELADRGSRFSGMPSLPEGMAWPSWDCRAYSASRIQKLERQIGADPHGERAKDLRRRMVKDEKLKSSSPLPLEFLAQIDLAEVAGLGIECGAPKTGMLYFFYDVHYLPWGSDPATFGSWRSVYSQSGSLGIREAPALFVPSRRRGPVGMRFEQEWTLPPRWTLEDSRVLTRAVPEYAGVCGKLSPVPRPVHRLGGWAQESDGDSRLEIQMAANGISFVVPGAMQHPRRAELEPGAKDWSMLLQLDSCGATTWCLGDMGRIHFWGRTEEMARGEFERTWISVESS